METRPSLSNISILRACVWLLVALVVLKFVALLEENGWDLSRAPWGLLLILIVAAVLVTLLLSKRPLAGAMLAAVVMLLFAAVVIAALARDGLERQAWADYPFAYGGLLVAVVGIYSALALRRGGEAH